MKFFNWIGISSITLIIAACGGTEDQDGTEIGLGADAAPTVGASAISGAINASNNSAGSSFAFNSEKISDRLFKSLNSFYTTYADVSTCGVPARADACSSGVRRATYADCSIGTTARKYSGSIVLTYSDASCLMNTNGDSFSRVVNMTRSGYKNSTFSTSSDSHQDYRGNTLSGGSTFIRSGVAAFNWSVGGIHKIRTKADGTKAFDISVRTTSDVSGSGSWDGDRTLNGGSIEVIHNLAQYVATLVPTNVVYNRADCCYPVSGSFAISYSGSVTGTASLTFNSCGSAVFSKDGVDKTVELPGCE